MKPRIVPRSSGRKSKNSVRSASVASEISLPFDVGGGLVVDVLQVGRLAAQPGAVVDDLAVDLLAGVVDEGHLRSLAPPPAVSSSAGRGLLADPAHRRSLTRSDLTEQGVDVVVGDLGEGAAVRRPCAPLSPFCSIVSKIFSSSTLARLTRRRTSPSDERSSKMTTRMARLADDRDVDVVLLPLVEEHRELALADQLGEAVGGRDVAGRQRGERGGVELLDLAGGGDLLAVLVDQEDGLGVGVRGAAGAAPP